MAVRQGQRGLLCWPELTWKSTYNRKDGNKVIITQSGSVLFTLYNIHLTALLPLLCLTVESLSNHISGDLCWILPEASRIHTAGSCERADRLSGLKYTMPRPNMLSLVAKV